MALLSRARAVTRKVEQGTCCPYCLVEFSKALSSDSDALDELRCGLHELWDALVISIAILDPKGPNAAFSRSLRVTVSRCSHHAGWDSLDTNDEGMDSGSDDPDSGDDSVSNEDNASQHSSDAGSESDSSDDDEDKDKIDLVEEFVNAACSCLHACLSIGDRSAVSRAEKKHKAFSNKRGAWPMRQEDLFPSGADSGGRLSDVESLIHWTLRVDTPDPAFLLADLLFIAHPIVFPLLVAARDELIEAVSDWINYPAAIRKLHRADPRDQGAFDHARRMTAAAIAILRSLRDAPDAEPNALLMFTLEYEEQLFEAANVGLGVLAALGGPETELFGEVASLAAMMHTRVTQPDSAVPPAVRARLPTKSSDMDIAGVLHTLIQTLSARRRICGGPNCGLSVHASENPETTFNRCARCKLVQYCSRTCQREDWKAGRGIQHKLACPVFCEILARSGVDLPFDEFRRKMASLSQNPVSQYELSLFACAHNRALPLEVVVRAGQIHREAAVVLGRPNVIADSTRDMEYLDRVLRRQEKWVPRFPPL